MRDLRKNNLPPHFLRAYLAKDLGSAVSVCTSDFNEASQLRELERFYSEHKDELSTGRVKVEKAIDRVKTNVEWRKRNFDRITNWLKKWTEKELVEIHDEQ